MEDLDKHPIVVFTTPQCAFCVMVKSYLQSRQIDFHEIDITTNQAAQLWLNNEVGQTGVPVTLFEGKAVVVGWQKNLIDHHLQQMKLG